MAVFAYVVAINAELKPCHRSKAVPTGRDRRSWHPARRSRSHQRARPGGRDRRRNVPRRRARLRPNSPTRRPCPDRPGSGRTDRVDPGSGWSPRPPVGLATSAARAPELVRRRFHAARPNELDVADFTYVPLDGGGFGYTAFVIDAFAGLIVGWECSLTKNTAFVERAIRQAGAFRARQDIGSPVTQFITLTPDQYTAIHFTETLMLEGLVPSVGTVGDCPRQRVGRNDDPAVQDRVRARGLPVSHRANPHPRQPGGHHLGVGALVQHGQADAPSGPTPTGGGPSRVLPAHARPPNTPLSGEPGVPDSGPGARVARGPADSGSWRSC